MLTSNKTTMLSANPGRGIFLSIASASFFGIVTTFARISYEQGSNPLTVGIFRALFGVCLCLIIILLRGNNLKIHKHGITGVTIVGTFTAGIALGYLGAIQFIPVGLSAILFFTWPILLLLYLSIRQPGLISIKTIVSFILAFLGLFLVIGPVFHNLQTIGIVLALIAACCAAGVFIASQHFFTSINLIVAAFWVNLITLIILCLITFAKDEFQLPTTNAGNWSLILASSSYAMGLLVMFLAIKAIGAARSSLYFNLEPLVASFAAMLLLGESLTAIQASGFAIVMSILFYTSIRQSDLSD